MTAVALESGGAVLLLAYMGKPDVSEGDDDRCAFWIFICFVNPMEIQHLIAGFFSRS